MVTGLLAAPVAVIVMLATLTPFASPAGLTLTLIAPGVLPAAELNVTQLADDVAEKAWVDPSLAVNDIWVFIDWLFKLIVEGVGISTTPAVISMVTVTVVVPDPVLMVIEPVYVPAPRPPGIT